MQIPGLGTLTGPAGAAGGAVVLAGLAGGAGGGDFVGGAAAVRGIGPAARPGKGRRERRLPHRRPPRLHRLADGRPAAGAGPRHPRPRRRRGRWWRRCSSTPIPTSADASSTLAAGDPALAGRIAELAAAADRCPHAARLPLVDLAVPALRRLSPSQYRAFRELVEGLVAADRKVSLFELTLRHVLLRHLDPSFGAPPATAVQYYSLARLGGEVVAAALGAGLGRRRRRRG